MGRIVLVFSVHGVLFYSGCGQALSSLASVAALGETCSFCKVKQRLPVAWICTSLAIPPGCCGRAVSEHLPGRETVNNTSARPRLQVVDWDADWRGTKGQKNDECLPKLFELWLYTQTCV